MVEMNSFGVCTQNSYGYIQTEKNGSHVLENQLFNRKDYIAVLGKKHGYEDVSVMW